MTEKRYTILDLSEQFNQSKQTIRRRVERLNIKAVNRKMREFPNDPLQYDQAAFNKLAEVFGFNNNDAHINDDTRRYAPLHSDDTQSCTENDAHLKEKEEKIVLLERELAYSKEKLTTAEKEKEQLLQLLDQQQQLTLQANRQIEQLQLAFTQKNKEPFERKADDPASGDPDKKQAEASEQKQKKGFFSRFFGQ